MFAVFYLWNFTYITLRYVCHTAMDLWQRTMKKILKLNFFAFFMHLIRYTFVHICWEISMSLMQCTHNVVNNKFIEKVESHLGFGKKSICKCSLTISMGECRIWSAITYSYQQNVLCNHSKLICVQISIETFYLSTRNAILIPFYEFNDGKNVKIGHFLCVCVSNIAKNPVWTA